MEGLADASWRAVVEGVAGETGERFFAALVKNLCSALGVEGAWVTEYLPRENRLRALAFWLGDDFVPEYEYDVAGTPCEPVLRTQDVVQFSDRVVELFPNDPDLAPLNAVAYMGQKLEDADGTILGHLAVLDTKRLPEDLRTTALFRVFAARAGAELRRLRAQAALRARERALSLLVTNVLDGIVAFDGELRVTLMNPAATKLFGCEAGEALGETVTRFLSGASRPTFLRLVDELVGPGSGRSSAWIPSGLTGRTLQGREFPAEATLSRADPEGSRLILLLRNVDDRRAAERRIAALTAETEALREELRELTGSGEILGRSPAVRRVLREIAQVAPTDATVLVQGETGTGKELAARAIHRASERAERPFVRVNCAAIPANLMESELFGHEKGAFTGATRARKGRFALADRGTIFLDEIGELPLDLQVKLLRVLQERELEPVGSSETLKIDVRVVAATNRDLGAEVEAGRFRQDLFYRLAVFPLVMPPLRDRGDDAALLAEHFARGCSRRLGRPVVPLDDANRELLMAYDWPGNVRELQNVVERAVITAADGRLDLERALPWSGRGVTRPQAVDAEPARVYTADEMVELERANLRRALDRCGGKVAGPGGAAEILGLPPSTLASRLRAFGLKS